GRCDFRFPERGGRSDWPGAGGLVLERRGAGARSASIGIIVASGSGLIVTGGPSTSAGAGTLERSGGIDACAPGVAPTAVGNGPHAASIAASSSPRRSAR